MLTGSMFEREEAKEVKRNNGLVEGGVRGKRVKILQ